MGAAAAWAWPHLAITSSISGAIDFAWRMFTERLPHTLLDIAEFFIPRELRAGDRQNRLDDRHINYLSIALNGPTTEERTISFNLGTRPKPPKNS
jgi:hypothetical protein